MKTALVLGGAICLDADVKAALDLFTPSIIIAVKDIGMTYPRVDHWVTFHIERAPRELALRRKAGLPDPQAFWTHKRAHIPSLLDIQCERIEVKGGSSGFMGVQVGLILVDRIVLAGIPMDPDMTHFYKRKGGKPWKEGRVFHQHWKKAYPTLKDRVRSMSGWTKELLGEPTRDWLTGVNNGHAFDPQEAGDVSQAGLGAQAP